MRMNNEITNREYLNVDWIVNKREKLGDALIEQIRTPDLASLKKELKEKEEFEQMVQSFMESLQPVVQEVADQIFELGALSDLLKQCEKLCDVLQKEQKSEADRFEEQTVYKDQILKILWEKEPILHKDLAEELQISTSNLSNVMKRMKNAAVPLLEENAVGKNKFYMLNREGRRYMLENMSSAGSNEEFETYALQKKHKNREKLEFRIDEQYIKFSEAFSNLEQERQREKIFVTFQYHMERNDRYKERTEFPNIHIEMKDRAEQRRKRYQHHLSDALNDYTRKEGLRSQGKDDEKNIERDGLFYQEGRKKLEDCVAQMYSGRCRRNGL